MAALWLYVAVVTVYLVTDIVIAFTSLYYDATGDGRNGISCRRFAVMMIMTLNCFVGDNGDGTCKIDRLTHLLFVQLQGTAW